MNRIVADQGGVVQKSRDIRDYVDVDGVRDVHFNWFTEGRLGGNIVHLPLVDALRRLCPNAKVHVGNLMESAIVPSLMRGMDEVDVKIHRGLSKLKINDASLVVQNCYNASSAGVELPHFINSNDLVDKGSLVVFNNNYSTHFSGSDPRFHNHYGVRGGKGRFYQCDEGELKSGYATNFRVYREIFHKMGIPVDLKPTIHITPQESQWAEKYLVDKLGFRKRGCCPRFFINTDVKTDTNAKMGFQAFSQVTQKVLDSDVDAMINPGASKTERRQAEQIVGNMGGDIQGFLANPIESLGLRKMLSILSRFDVVITPNTGIMHAANAVGVKTVLATMSYRFVKTWTPEGEATLTMDPNINELMTSIDGTKKLISGEGFEWGFTDPEKARELGRDYVGLIKPFDGFLDAEKDEFIQATKKLDDIRNRLKVILKLETAGVLHRIILEGLQIPSDIWYSHQQSALYRFSSQALMYEDLKKDGQVRPELMPEIK